MDSAKGRGRPTGSARLLDRKKSAPRDALFFDPPRWSLARRLLHHRADQILTHVNLRQGRHTQLSGDMQRHLGMRV